MQGFYFLSYGLRLLIYFLILLFYWYNCILVRLKSMKCAQEDALIGLQWIPGLFKIKKSTKPQSYHFLPTNWFSLINSNGEKTARGFCAISTHLKQKSSKQKQCLTRDQICKRSQHVLHLCLIRSAQSLLFVCVDWRRIWTCVLKNP